MVDYSGYQSLPTGETVSMVPATGGLEAGSAIDPMLAAYFKKIGLDPAMAATLSADDMKRMAYSAREDAYNTAMQADLQRSGKLQRIGTTYAEAHPEDYYNTFGTIPLQSLGKSRFGVTDAGALDTKEGAEGIKYLTPDETATYSLYSPRSGQTLGTGTGAQGLLSLAQMAQNQTANKDRKADWQLIKTPAGGGAPEVISSNLYNTNLSTLGKIVAAGLPIATAFIPGLNLATAIATGAGAGGLSAAMREQNILKGALIGGATAGIMKAPVLGGGKSLEGVIGGALNKVPVVGDTLRGIGNALDLPAAAQRAAAQKASTDIVVNAATKAVPNLVTGGLGSLVNAAVSQPLTQGPTEPRRQDYGGKEEEPGTTVIGTKPAPVPVTPPYNFNADFDNTFYPGTDGIVVEAKKQDGPINISTLPYLPSLTPNTSGITEPSTLQPEAQPGKSTVDKIIGGLKLAGLASAFLGGGSGGSGGSSATMPFGMGASNPLYSAKLPTPGVNGAFQVGGMGATLPVPAGGDYTRFGMGSAPTRVAPADIPQYGGVIPAGFNRDTLEWLGPQPSAPAVDFSVLPNPGEEPVKKAMGGYAVGGPGTGRSDEIPAMLSDGEYVMDAETVALLGDGSNKAGAKALDKFRANIRKQKGRKLAQGKFSVKAKQPEAYLSGGR